MAENRNRLQKHLWGACSLFILTSCYGTEDSSLEELSVERSPLDGVVDVPRYCDQKFVRPIRVRPHLLVKDHMSIKLFDGESILASVQHRSVGEGRGWIGEVQGYPGSTVALRQQGGTITGHILFGEKRFRIIQQRRGQVLCKVDQNAAPSGCASISVDASMLARKGGAVLEESNIGTQDTPQRVRTASQTKDAIRIDVMVLYTPKARNINGRSSIEARIKNAMASANQAYVNSKVPIRLKLVHMAEIEYRESGMGTDLERLQAKNDKYMTAVHSWRDKYGADLVSLVVDDNRSCGLGYVMTEKLKSFASFGFSVVNAECLDHHTLAHEIGHNLGNVHNRENTKRPGVHPYAYGHRRCSRNDTGFRTIMSYPCARADYINYFSNPKVLYGAFATGIDHKKDARKSADTARSMILTADLVASFRDSRAAKEDTPSSEPVLLAPSRLSATVLSRASIRLRWKDNARRESNFEIERKVERGDWKRIATVKRNAESFRNGGLRAGTRYWYRIRAKRDQQSSPYTKEVSAKTLGAPSTEKPVGEEPPDGPLSGRFDWHTEGSKQTVRLDASSSVGKIVSYIWSFGDGLTSEGEKVVHTYKKDGKYTVTLTVVDDRNMINKKRRTVTITR